MRVHKHREGTYDGFTKKYKVNRLMYFETTQDQKFADFREKQIKKYRREKKVALIEKDNPRWEDLSKDLYSIKRVPPPRLRTSMEQE
jgi:putative endonuclease